MANPYKAARSRLLQALTGAPYTFSYAADGFGVKHKYVPFFADEQFDRAWNEVEAVHRPIYPNGLADIRWRAHTCLWAARHCLSLPGDFAEFGVNTGIFAQMIYRILPLAGSGKRFFLFDTFAGIPEETTSIAEKAQASKLNAEMYDRDVYAFTTSIFEAFSGAELVRGILPQSLSQVNFDTLSYVSVDLNVAAPEIAVAEAIWDRIVPGGIIVLDDYGFGGHEAQNRAWNDFAARVSRGILAMPTGQGILIR